MDLRSLANSATQAINPNILVTIKRSLGNAIGPGLKQVPTYDTPVTGYAQVQALDGSELKHVEGLNIQGTLRAIYLRGSLAGVIRPDGKGGDLVLIDGKVWLVVKVLESWPDWTKAVLVYQGAA